MTEQNDKTNYGLVALFGLILILMFFIGRLTKKVPDPAPTIDLAPFQRRIDSLQTLSAQRQDTILFERKKIDSLSRLRRSGHAIVKKRLDEIQKFTPDARARWRDSVRRSNGL